MCQDMALSCNSLTDAGLAIIIYTQQDELSGSALPLLQADSYDRIALPAASCIAT